MELITVQDSNEINISSRDIASLTNKEHRHVLRDIEVAQDNPELDQLSMMFEEAHPCAERPPQDTAEAGSTCV